jgi:transcriptional regulator with XRE-family HTH domain
MELRITLAAARVNAGLTQVELASKMGVSPATVNMWERGKVQIKAAQLRKLCRIVGLSESNIRLP